MRTDLGNRGDFRTGAGGGGSRNQLFVLRLDGGEPEAITHKLDVLKGHCETEGRDPAEIKITILGVGSDAAGDPDGFLSAMEGYAKLGVELVEIVPPTGTDPVEYVAKACEVIPRLTELG